MIDHRIKVGRYAVTDSLTTVLRLGRVAKITSVSNAFVTLEFMKHDDEPDETKRYKIGRIVAVCDDPAEVDHLFKLDRQYFNERLELSQRHTAAIRDGLGLVAKPRAST